MKEVTCEELENILKNQSSAFLCGNGFSINFDKDFANIYDRLYEAHRIVIRNGVYKVESDSHIFNKVFRDNYKSVISYIRNIKNNYFEEVFTDGINFAKSIIDNKKLLQELENEGLVNHLVFGKSSIDLVKSIFEVGISKGFKFVNIEYWTILIYFYFGILNLKSSIYEFPKHNEFILLIKQGNINKNPISKVVNDINQYALSNGFNTYYRMLFCTAILSNKKAIDFSLLENTYNLKIDDIKQFLDYFKARFTLNYDWILDYLNNDTLHLHGKYEAQKTFVFCQSLGILTDDNIYLSYSDILIGDYFVNKITAGLINSLNKNLINKKVYKVNDIIEAEAKTFNIDVFVIFGINIDNDQHILRAILVELAKYSQYKAKIVYCYFSDEDKDIFNEQYNHSITFSKELNKQVNKIELLYIKTQDILHRYFYK